MSKKIIENQIVTVVGSSNVEKWRSMTHGGRVEERKDAENNVEIGSCKNNDQRCYSVE